MVKLGRTTACVLIVISAVVATLSVIGIVFLCIFMPNDGAWEPFGSTSAGVYKTQTIARLFSVRVSSRSKFTR